MLLILKQVCQIISRHLSLGRKIRPGRHLELLLNKIDPRFRPAEYSRIKLAGLHNNTLAVYLHAFHDRAGRNREIVEKNNRRAWKQSGFFPEVYFYKNISPPRGGAVQAPQCYSLERGSLSYRLFIEKIVGRRVDLDHNFEAVLEAIDSLQAEAPAADRLTGEARALLYFKQPLSQRFRGDYSQYLQSLRVGGQISADMAASFESGLSALAETCAAFKAVLNHLDLLPGNLLINDGRVVFIDWEKYYYAPAGFSQGNWLYSIFRKKENQLNQYLARWRQWLETSYICREEREERILAGLFCYFCFVLEFLARQNKKIFRDKDQKRRQDSGEKLWKQLALLTQAELIQAPQVLLNRLIEL